ncbi:MAG: hypothetical protein ABI340_09075 [Nitrososphaera sp.]|jgi:hypothetical protein
MKSRLLPPHWEGHVVAPFKKVIAFDLAFLGLGAMIGAGITAAIFLR